MSFAKHDFASRIAVDPSRAAHELVGRYRAAKCSQKAVAAAYGCSQNTIARWIGQLEDRGTGVRAVLARIKRQAIREGWHHDDNRQGGRKIGARDGVPRKRRAKVRMEERPSIRRKRVA